MAAERPPLTRTPPRPQEAADAAAGFRQRGRVRELYLALLLLVVGLYLSPLVSGDAPADPSYWWLVPVVLIGGLTLPLARWLYRCSASVRVTEGGLQVRDRLVVPAEKMGAVEVVGGTQAAWAGLLGARAFPRVPARQNLYGGGLGWGKGVGVEHVRRDGSSWWLLPGPRAEELAEALRAARDRAARPGSVPRDR